MTFQELQIGQRFQFAKWSLDWLSAMGDQIRIGEHTCIDVKTHRCTHDGGLNTHVRRCLMTPTRFKEIREGLGLDQTRVRRIMHVAKETVWRWEHGQHRDLRESRWTSSFAWRGSSVARPADNPSPPGETR